MRFGYFLRSFSVRNMGLARDFFKLDVFGLGGVE